MTERENKMLRHCHKIIDYEIGSAENQKNAKSRRDMVYEKRRKESEDLITQRLKIVTILKSGYIIEINREDDKQVKVFLKLRDEGLVQINEVEPKKYLATWKN